MSHEQHHRNGDEARMPESHRAPWNHRSDSNSKYQLAVVPENTVGESKRKRNLRHERKGDGDEKEESTLDSLFGNTRPKHLGTGLVSGMMSVVKGVAYGAGALVAAPIIGAVESGPSGFVKGAGLGVAAAVAYPVAGMVAGVKQVGQGAMNTKEAYRESGAGKVYDDKSGKWIDKYRVLDDEYQECLAQKVAMEAEKAEHQQMASRIRHITKQGNTHRAVADTEYYDILGVATDATEAQIRKAYYQLAKECHPDKHGGDPTMKERFQQVGEAYQVLGDAERRNQYDIHGRAAAEKMEFLDHSIFFAMLFGSEAMEAYIGKLKLAAMVEDEDDEGGEVDAERRKIQTLYREAQQAFREVELARLLRDRLEAYVQARKHHIPSDCDLWKNQQYETASRLCEESFGAEIVDAIGFAYENYANQYIGKRDNWLGAAPAKLQMQKRQFDTIFAALQSASKASKETKKQQKKQRKEKPKSSPETEAPSSDGNSPGNVEAMEKSLEHILQTMLHICIADITSTIRSACRKALNDKAIDELEQRYRAEGLQFLGAIFESASNDYRQESKKVDAMEQMQEAYIKAAQKMDEKQHARSPAPPN